MSAASIGGPKDEEQPALPAGLCAAPRAWVPAAEAVPAAVVPAQPWLSGSHLL